MTRVLLGLGSNIEPRLAYLRRAVAGLGCCGTVAALAPVYESPPYGVTDQAAFLNTAALLDTERAPLALLAALKAIEGELGRQRRERWGPREIDIDIIFYGEQIVDLDGLTIPHPDAHNRRFVLRPLADLAPGWRDPRDGRTVQELLDTCGDSGALILHGQPRILDDASL